jgi:AcrR family transcriptional regulator
METASRRSRREERREETRRELVASATKLFAERGFHATSLEQIAREAGYTTGAIYFHFGGKDQLFIAAFESYALTRVAEVTKVYEQASGPLPKVARAFADHWMARQAADPAFMVVALEFFVHSLRHPHLREELAARQAAVRLAVGRMLEQETRAAGVDLPMPAQDIATVGRELGIGLALAKLLDPEAFPDSLYGDFLELFYELALKQAGEQASDLQEDHREPRRE